MTLTQRGSLDLQFGFRASDKGLLNTTVHIYLNFVFLQEVNQGVLCSSDQVLTPVYRDLLCFEPIKALLQLHFDLNSVLSPNPRVLSFPVWSDTPSFSGVVSFIAMN